MLGEKIKLLLQKEGVSQSEIGNAIGMSQAGISMIIKGTREPNIKNIPAICKALNTSPNVLFGFEDVSQSGNDVVRLEVLDVRACCGNGVANFQEGVIGYHYVSKNILRKLSFSSPSNIKIIEAVGDSMTPTINPYDMLWIDISVKEPANDGMYLLTVGNELMIKRIQINPFNNQVQVKSDNPQYAPIIMDNYREISVLGRVIYHMKRVG